MVRVTSAPASRKRRKRLLKKAKGFFGDRKNHIRQAANAVMRAMAYNFAHRKKRKGDFRSIWIVRIGVAAKIHGISYSSLINGLKKVECIIDRKMLSDLAVRDPEAFGAVVEKAKSALSA